MSWKVLLKASSIAFFCPWFSNFDILEVFVDHSVIDIANLSSMSCLTGSLSLPIQETVK